MKSQFLTLILSALFSLFGMQQMSAGNWEKSFKEAVEAVVETKSAEAQAVEVKQAVMQADDDPAIKEENNQGAVYSQNSREGLLGTTSETTPAGGEKTEEETRNQKTNVSSLSKAHSQEAKVAARSCSATGANQHSSAGDAQQERTKTIRFLHLEAGID